MQLKKRKKEKDKEQKKKEFYSPKGAHELENSALFL